MIRVCLCCLVPRSLDRVVSKTSHACKRLSRLHSPDKMAPTNRKLLYMYRCITPRTSWNLCKALLAIYMVLAVVAALASMFSLWHLAQFQKLPSTARSTRKVRLVIAARYGPVHASSAPSRTFLNQIFVFFFICCPV